jgi:hypothetical protein
MEDVYLFSHDEGPTYIGKKFEALDKLREFPDTVTASNIGLRTTNYIIRDVVPKGAILTLTKVHARRGFSSRCVSYRGTLEWEERRIENVLTDFVQYKWLHVYEPRDLKFISSLFEEKAD